MAYLKFYGVWLALSVALSVAVIGLMRRLNRPRNFPEPRMGRSIQPPAWRADSDDDGYPD